MITRTGNLSDEMEGRMAYTQGHADTVCPHESGQGKNDRRVRWMSGYWGERVDQFLAQFDEKYSAKGAKSCASH